MVADITASLRARKKAGHLQAWVVEIVGPAGAGKTTLYRALEKNAPAIRTGSLPPVWDIRYSPFYAKNIISLVPMLVRLQGKGDRGLTRRELAWMAILQGWPEVLSKGLSRENQVILLDQGPLFLMAVLAEFGPGSLRNAALQPWWENIYARWIHSLDLVIWLDAADEILMERIRTRQMDHPVKGQTDLEIKEFLAKYRQVYSRLIGTICKKDQGASLLRIDTGVHPAGEIAQCLMDQFRAAEMNVP